MPGYKLFFNKVNVHTHARALAQEEETNFVAFAAVLRAFMGNDLSFHLFSQSDIVAFTVAESDHDGYAFHVGNGAAHVVFERKLPFTLKLNLIHVFDGTFGAPMFQLSDSAVPSGSAMVLKDIVGLSPYPGGVGHVIIVNPLDAGQQAFFSLVFAQVFELHAEQRALFNLPLDNVALHITDGEIPQMKAASAKDNLLAADKSNTALAKHNPSLSQKNAAPDMGKTHVVIHAFVKHLRTGGRPRWLRVDKRILTQLREQYAAESRRLFGRPGMRKGKRSVEQYSFVCRA